MSPVGPFGPFERIISLGKGIFAIQITSGRTSRFACWYHVTDPEGVVIGIHRRDFAMSDSSGKTITVIVKETTTSSPIDSPPEDPLTVPLPSGVVTHYFEDNNDYRWGYNTFFNVDGSAGSRAGWGEGEQQESAYVYNGKFFRIYSGMNEHGSGLSSITGGYAKSGGILTPWGAKPYDEFGLPFGASIINDPNQWADVSKNWLNTLLPGAYIINNQDPNIDANSYVKVVVDGLNDGDNSVGYALGRVMLFFIDNRFYEKDIYVSGGSYSGEHTLSELLALPDHVNHPPTYQAQTVVQRGHRWASQANSIIDDYYSSKPSSTYGLSIYASPYTDPVSYLHPWVFNGKQYSYFGNPGNTRDSVASYIPASPTSLAAASLADIRQKFAVGQQVSDMLVTV